MNVILQTFQTVQVLHELFRLSNVSDRFLTVSERFVTVSGLKMATNDQETVNNVPIVENAHGTLTFSLHKRKINCIKQFEVIFMP